MFVRRKGEVRDVFNRRGRNEREMGFVFVTGKEENKTGFGGFCMYSRKMN